MARRKRQRPEEITRRVGSIERPFSSCPTIPPKYGFYVYNAHGHFIYQSFVGIYAAKRFIEVVTEHTTYKWINCATILAENGVKITTTTQPDPKPSDFKHFDLEEVVEHEYTDEEEAWEIPEPYASLWQKFPRSVPVEQRPEEERRERREQRPARPQRNEDFISVTMVAQEMNIEPGKARQALRKSGETKPPQGWEWAPTDIERIKAVIKEHL